MNDAKLNIEIELNTPEAISEAKRIKEGIATINTEAKKSPSVLNENVGILQRLSRAAEIYKKGMNEATRVENIEKYSQKLADVNAEISRLNRPQNTGGGQWNGLQNSINQISRELPAFTYSIQTGFMAISNNLPIFVDEINRAKLANQQLTASGQQGVPVWKQLISGMFSWGTALSVGITLLTVYGKEIGEWITALFKGKDALQQLKQANEEFKQTRLKGAQDAQKELVSLESLYRATQKATLSVQDRKRAVDELQNKYPSYFKNFSDEEILAGKAAASYDKLKTAIIGAARARAYQDKIAELASKRLENEDKINDLASQSIDAESKYKKEKEKLSRTDAFGNVQGYNIALSRASGAQTGVEVIKKDITDLNTANNELDKQMQRYQNSIDNIVDKNGVSAITDFGSDADNKKATDLYAKIAKSRDELQEKLLDLDKEYARKSMVSDQAELQALKDKFGEFRKIIETENKKISDFNLKNKTSISLIDIGQIDPIENRATADLLYTQETKRLATELEKQKQLFADYEDYKEKLGLQKANEAFKARLKGYENYNQYLQSVAQKESEAFAAVGNKTATAGQDERVKLFEKEQKEVRDAETKKQTELLALMITYDQKRKELIRKFEEDRAALVTAATAEELTEFDRKHIEQLNNLDDSHIQQLAAYKALFGDIEKLSDAAARKVIADAKAMLKANVNISGDERKKIQGAINDAATSLDKRLPDRVAKLSNEFADMASNIGRVDEGLGSMLKSVSDVLRATVQINSGIDGLTKGIANYNKTKNDPASTLLDKVSGIAGIAGPVGQIVGAVGSVVSGVIGFFNAASESARQAKEQMRKYKEEILSGELEYNRLLRERARDQGAINDMTLKELEIQKELLATQLKAQQLREVTYNKENASFIDKMLGNDKVTAKEMLSDYEYALKRIQNEGLQVTGQKTEKYGGFLGIGKKTRVVDITASLAGKTYEDLEKLYTEGKMTESTKAMFEALQKAKKEVDDINGLMKEIDEAIMDKMSGSVSANSISSSIIKGLKEGKRAVVDFADDVEEVIQNAFLSAMSATVLEEPLKELVKKFREDSKDGLSTEEVDKFKQAYNQIVQSGIDAMKDIEKVTGSIGGDKSSISSGRINRTISEATAGEILGFERARYDIAKQSFQQQQKAINDALRRYDSMVDYLQYLPAIEKNTGDTANNTADAVIQLQNAVTELKAINKSVGIKVSR